MIKRLLVVTNQQNRTVWKSLGGNGGCRLGDVQMVTGVAEHDPRRRLTRGAWNENRGRLPRGQYCLEPRNHGLLSRTLLSGYCHVEAVGFVDVVDQGGEVLTGFRPMGGRGSYVRRLDRDCSGNGERCSRQKSPSSHSSSLARY